MKDHTGAVVLKLKSTSSGEGFDVYEPGGEHVASSVGGSLFVPTDPQYLSKARDLFAGTEKGQYAYLTSVQGCAYYGQTEYYPFVVQSATSAGSILYAGWPAAGRGRGNVHHIFGEGNNVVGSIVVSRHGEDHRIEVTPECQHMQVLLLAMTILHIQQALFEEQPANASGQHALNPIVVAGWGQDMAITQSYMGGGAGMMFM